MTEVKFLKPFYFAASVGVDNIPYRFAVTSAMAQAHGFVDDELAAELIGLGLAEEIV